jgi:hypothetical protein
MVLLLIAFLYSESYLINLFGKYLYGYWLFGSNMPSVDIGVYETSEIGDAGAEAMDALQSLDSMLYDGDVDINVFDERAVSIDDDMYYDNRSKTVEDLEFDLYNSGHLGWNNIHVIIYNETDTGNEMGGAGFSVWQVGEPNSDPEYAKYVTANREYNVSDGKYALAFVNVATRGFPYSNQWFRNTVIHEVGHTFHCEHQDGEIEIDNGSYVASPMCTWYVESSYYTSNDINADNLCQDENQDETDNHTEQISLCTDAQFDSHANQYL